MEVKHSYYSHHPSLDAVFQALFGYLRMVWVDSQEHLWYEGANPFGIGHNQSIEGFNKGIKENQTFRLKLPMGELFTVTLRLVKEHSKVCMSKKLERICFIFR